MSDTLKGRIAAEIARDGPITVERFWQIALFDRHDGYYASAEPFGRAGDFTTAPEISQMFGELIGAWCATAWDALGRPRPFLLAEIGPGRGILMDDVLRTLRHAAPACLAAARIRMVETSERLAAVQAARLERYDLPIKRVRRVGELEALPTILVANELFDALPIRQLIRAGGRWRERRVGVDASGALSFVVGEPTSAIPHWIEGKATPAPQEGAIAEFSPAREALAGEIGARLAGRGGAGLFIDYGHPVSAHGDTLQAVSKHRFAPVLDDPGHVDLTSHVDFDSLRSIFAGADLHVSDVVPQGRFLLAMGLLERAGTLGAPLDQEGREAIEAAVHRLAGSGRTDMGELFKVLAVSSQPMIAPPFVRDGGD